MNLNKAFSNGKLPFEIIAELYPGQFEWIPHETYDLDLIYMIRSGEKESSPMIDVLASDGVLLEDARKKAVKATVSFYKRKWDRLWEVETATYNPIENYSMTETETPNISRKESVSDDYSLNTDVQTKEKQTVISQADGSNSVYGFNSTNPVPSAQGEQNGTTTTERLPENNNVSQKQTQSGYREQTETGTRTLTRSGNIGVTTTQQMIQSSIELSKWTFLAEVMRDLDSMFTTPLYF